MKVVFIQLVKGWRITQKTECWEAIVKALYQTADVLPLLDKTEGRTEADLADNVVCHIAGEMLVRPAG